MGLQVLRFLALLLAALGLAMGMAHVLELPVKMTYDANLYLSVTSTLYRWFALVGAPIQVAAILVACVLTWRVRRRRSFSLSLAGALLLLASLGLWFALVQPVNATWATVLRQDPAAAPESFVLHRNQWEYGHVAAFAAWLLGTLALIASVLRDVDADAGLSVMGNPPLGATSKVQPGAGPANNDG